MQVGAAMFFTDYSMGAADLAQALETRGFESVWAPEHSHIPTSRPRSTRSRADGFCSGSAAAGTPRRWKITAPSSKAASS